MFYLDSQRTITRRESSLIVPKRSRSCYFDEFDTVSLIPPPPLSIHFNSESCASFNNKPSGTVRKELITLLLESMLDNIIVSYEVIVRPQPEELQTGRVASDIVKAKKKSLASKSSKFSRKSSRSRSELVDLYESETVQQQGWWSAPDESAVIHFTNGCVYEGDISMKLMHGMGRYQWADGCVYMGHFKNNQINGHGKIQWKDETWYEGEFNSNVRHGRGLYVNSRQQTSYIGDWYSGMKHGKGVIYYSGTMQNSYDGDWVYNVRQGFGSREYCATSGYKGEWDYYVRDGIGIMVWPNHDFYSGHWKNGVMSGYGLYIWNFIFNSSMSVPALNVYHGEWKKGTRNGYGEILFGINLGAYYKGEFAKNLKNGFGKLVTNCGAILQSKRLFINDNMALSAIDTTSEDSSRCTDYDYNVGVNDCSISIIYHINEVLNNIDVEKEQRDYLINDFFSNNRHLGGGRDLVNIELNEPHDLEDFILFEQRGLYNAITCYETDLRNIYYKYATIYNKEEIIFNPIMIRLNLWQLYYDCGMLNKGLTLVEIDKLFFMNTEWLAKNLHNPFERVYYWQFIQSMLTVARVLYADRQLPKVKPDTILAKAFRRFMEEDILPKTGSCYGRFLNLYSQFVPLKSLYGLYYSLGEPHTVRTFLCAIREPPHFPGATPYDLVDLLDENMPIGKNVCLYGEDINFVTEENWIKPDVVNSSNLNLYNLANVSGRSVIKYFAEVIPQVGVNDLVTDLDVEITFFEFMEAFFAISEESIRLDIEERKRRLAEQEIENTL